jgi:hypothetical protein
LFTGASRRICAIWNKLYHGCRLDIVYF